MSKVAFVTGGDKGIGRAIVQQLHSSFDHVICTYNTNLSGVKELESQYQKVVFFQCDLRNFDEIKSLIQVVLGKYHHIDVLINNAGYESDAIFSKMHEEQWLSVLNINLVSLFYFANAFLPGMVSKGWGRIINVTSIAAYTGAFGKSNYAAAKAGIVGFTKSLALEYGNKGITVNAIAPGAIETDMLMRIPNKYREQIQSNIPMRRFGSVNDIAELVEFLITSKANYINGQTIHVNGGSYML